jgi:uncharacterized protein YprB with RNaseH-like and TPR domain
MATVAPVARLKKAEIVWLANNRCRHSHTYLEHFNCYLEEKPGGPLEVKTGYLDIETSDLKADFGIVFCYCIKDENSDKIYERTITAKEMKSGALDKPVLQQFIKDVANFDRVVTYYGTRFDIPFLRTRAVVHKLKYPEYGELIHTDLYYLIRNKFQLSRNSLLNACNTLLGSADKTFLDKGVWMRARFGDDKALEYIVEHCRYDVLDLQKLHDVAIPYRKRIDSPA